MKFTNRVPLNESDGFRLSSATRDVDTSRVSSPSILVSTKLKANFLSVKAGHSIQMDEKESNFFALISSMDPTASECVWRTRHWLLILVKNHLHEPIAASSSLLGDSHAPLLACS